MEYQSQEIGELAKALALAQGKMTFAIKENAAPVFEKNDAGKAIRSGKMRTYADLSSVIEAIRGPLSENGLAFVQAVMPSISGVRIRTTLMHSSGQWIAGEISLPPDKMNGIHGMGSALTYARRYALAAMVGIAQDDDDGEAAMAASRKAETQRIQQVRKQAVENNPDAPSPEMFKALMATLTERGLRERDDILRELSDFLGRDVRSSRELTRSEVSDYLNAVHETAEDHAF